ncbi:hypothetical protein DPMN_189388 [Dreissena polymorpha]|uniref:Uncharacterized protein n=1 Tax=Dreissena polymorpha TaxID=45954 RepID=A0A9D4IC60_DREPO|nr:hypothetical protein DPMN_189388 [Dreissena polymorpha]
MQRAGQQDEPYGHGHCVLTQSDHVGKGLVALFTEGDEDAPNVYQERKRNN